MTQQQLYSIELKKYRFTDDQLRKTLCYPNMIVEFLQKTICEAFFKEHYSILICFVLFCWVQLTIRQYWFRCILPDKHQAITRITHWGRVTHKCIVKLGHNWPDRLQAITQTSAVLFLIGSLGTNFSEIEVGFLHFHSRKCIRKCHLESCGHFVSASMC